MISIMLVLRHKIKLSSSLVSYSWKHEQDSYVIDMSCINLVLIFRKAMAECRTFIRVQIPGWHYLHIFLTGGCCYVLDSFLRPDVKLSSRENSTVLTSPWQRSPNLSNNILIVGHYLPWGRRILKVEVVDRKTHWVGKETGL